MRFSFSQALIKAFFNDLNLNQDNNIYTQNRSYFEKHIIPNVDEGWFINYVIE